MLVRIGVAIAMPALYFYFSLPRFLQDVLWYTFISSFYGSWILLIVLSTRGGPAAIFFVVVVTFFFAIWATLSFIKTCKSAVEVKMTKKEVNAHPESLRTLDMKDVLVQQEYKKNVASGIKSNAKLELLKLSLSSHKTLSAPTRQVSKIRGPEDYVEDSESDSDDDDDDYTDNQNEEKEELAGSNSVRQRHFKRSAKTSIDSNLALIIAGAKNEGVFGPGQSPTGRMGTLTAMSFLRQAAFHQQKLVSDDYIPDRPTYPSNKPPRLLPLPEFVLKHPDDIEEEEQMLQEAEKTSSELTMRQQAALEERKKAAATLDETARSVGGLKTLKGMRMMFQSSMAFLDAGHHDEARQRINALRREAGAGLFLSDVRSSIGKVEGVHFAGDEVTADPHFSILSANVAQETNQIEDRHSQSSPKATFKAAAHRVGLMNSIINQANATTAQTKQQQNAYVLSNPPSPLMRALDRNTIDLESRKAAFVRTLSSVRERGLDVHTARQQLDRDLSGGSSVNNISPAKPLPAVSLPEITPVVAFSLTSQTRATQPTSSLHKSQEEIYTEMMEKVLAGMKK